MTTGRINQVSDEKRPETCENKPKEPSNRYIENAEMH